MRVVGITGCGVQSGDLRVLRFPRDTFRQRPKSFQSVTNPDTVGIAL
jgi:hypothetical protein